MHVHIATAGESIEPVINGVNAIPGPIDKIYLLSGKRFRSSAERLQEHYRMEHRTCVIREVNGFDFQEIVNAIYDIHETEYTKNTEFSINITGGTNLMTAAACSTAFMIGAKLYYVLYDPENPEQPLSERLVNIPAPKLPDVSKISPKQKTIISWVAELDSSGRTFTNTDIAHMMSITKASASTHIKNLKAMGMIESKHVSDKKDGRFDYYGLTKEGRMVSKWLMN